MIKFKNEDDSLSNKKIYITIIDNINIIFIDERSNDFE